ncbi:hypothetical protein [Actinomadura rudentiformis]|uniref:C2H2-type domain-containing protein n=1 Tax=Actinomadura rudentiformis TaxID=359158 RepID=A0A6H9YE68_9ACTN|nr:hypothetical protein [Actinomadura rudentiformis]KAB2344061.1 hypothetical protein F8566_32595 [Actinomadura rudentiformis]
MAVTEGVGAVRDAWSSHESWVYECLCCSTTWEEQFEARHTADGHGGEAVVYEHDGHRCTTPWTDHVCPNCESQNVKALPAPWAKRSDVPLAHRGDDLELVFRLRRLHAW